MGNLVQRDVKVAYIKPISENKMTTKDAAKELGVNEGTVYNW